MKLEQAYGIPVAPISTYVFENLVRDKQRTTGVPLPFIFTPHPVIGLSPEALDEYIEGNDPDTSEPVIRELIDALTKPIGKTKLEPESTEAVNGGTPQVLLEPDTEDNLQRLFYERGWTDGLPIILPTEERVEKMLTGTSHSRDEVVGEIFQPDTREQVKYTVSNIAVISVMAGARPEHFPVILAIASTKQSALVPSTTAFSAMLLVNGPIRNEISMNSGIGALSPVNLANSVIGRAWTLMSICWGYAKPKKSLWSSQGSNLVYNNMCVAENEERSVWTPFHVEKGFEADESVVSIFRGWAVINSSGAASNRSLGEELKIQLPVIPPLNSRATIIMDPAVARNLKENEGFSTKQDYCRWLSQNIKMPAGQYWKTDYIDMLVTSEAYKGVEPYASWKKVPDDELIAPYHNPDNINLIVVGGETSPLWKASDYGHIASVSIDKWRANNSNDECEDGTCWLPDEPVEHS
ncbi:MAG: UGSC family (seleno)protein [Dehalococcoidales bacterium]